ncbi:hypothetical protein F4604DRAFT_1926668 [Suillus subluteus]|nr:hypothetical protein F4604DRAFT_1926668 [Suillus subluteus]
MASFLDAPMPVCPLYISGVIVNFSKSKQNVESTEIQISLKLPIPVKCGAGKALRQTFCPPIKLSLGDTFSLHVRYKTWHGTGHEDIIFEPEDMFRKHSAREGQEYHKVHKKITIVVELSGNPTTETEQFVSSDESLELRHTTDDIFRKCPQFRILVIGKTGVGKSSLINHAFGVQNAARSASTMNSSLHRTTFVLHDSKGFEPGEKDNLKIVRDFINRRRAKPDLKDQLHAVWWDLRLDARAFTRDWCGAISHIEARRRAREIVRSTAPHRSQLTQVKVPIVAVFTKYDILLDRVERTLDKSSIKGLSQAAIQDIIKKNAEDKLQEICVAPLEKFAKSAIPHVTVSTNGNHEETLARLIQTTEELVRNHVGTDASVMTSVAQRVDPGLKIKASIE